MKPKKTFIFIIFTVLLLAACGTENNSNDENGTLNLKSADVVEKASPHTKGMEKFAEDLEENSDGKIKMKHYSDGQLGDEESLISGVKSGSINFVATGILPDTEVPEAFGSPFLFSDEENLNDVINSDLEEKILDKVNEEAGTKNLKVIGMIPNMTRVITTKDKEINKPEDMKNLKIRVPETTTYINTFENLGANPTPLAFTELYTALQTGVIDAQENPYQIIYDSSLFEVQNTISVTNHITPARWLIVNEDFYDSLSSEQEELILETWRDAELHMEELIEKNTGDYIEKLKSEGMKFVEPDIEPFVEATKEMQDHTADVLGEEIYDGIKELGDN